MDGRQTADEIILRSLIGFLSIFALGVHILFVCSYVTFHGTSEVYVVLLCFVLTFCLNCKHMSRTTPCF